MNNLNSKIFQELIIFFNNSKKIKTLCEKSLKFKGFSFETVVNQNKFVIMFKRDGLNNGLDESNVSNYDNYFTISINENIVDYSISFDGQIDNRILKLWDLVLDSVIQEIRIGIFEEIKAFNNLNKCNLDIKESFLYLNNLKILLEKQKCGFEDESDANFYEQKAEEERKNLARYFEIGPFDDDRVSVLKYPKNDQCSIKFFTPLIKQEREESKELKRSSGLF